MAEGSEFISSWDSLEIWDLKKQRLENNQRLFFNEPQITNSSPSLPPDVLDGLGQILQWKHHFFFNLLMSPRFKNYRVITETQFNSTNICRVLKSQLNLLSGLWQHMPPKAQLARRGKNVRRTHGKDGFFSLCVRERAKVTISRRSAGGKVIAA